MQCAVYEIRNLQVARVYVGVTSQLGPRWRQHLRWLRGGRHPNAALQADWSIFGESSFRFSILEWVDHPELMANRELYWLEHLKQTFGLYNNPDALVYAHKIRSPRSPLLKCQLEVFLAGFALKPHQVLDQFQNQKTANLFYLLCKNRLDTLSVAALQEMLVVLSSITGTRVTMDDVFDMSYPFKPEQTEKPLEVSDA